MLIGILGGGQLGRMLALAGYPLGLSFRCLETTADAPAGPLCDLQVGSFTDETALARFVDGLDLVTYEFENVPVASAEWLTHHRPVYPPPQALAAAQERLAEKNFFTQLSIPTPRFCAIDESGQIDAALKEIGLPAVLKTRRMGYDGKGQLHIQKLEDAKHAWERLGGVPLILEEWIAFDREVSILAVRSRTDEVAFYPLVENHHRGGILRKSLAPAPGLTPELQKQAEQYAKAVLQALQYVGVLAIEFFQVGNRLLANEMAPRVHNSGHWTIEGAVTSQFENHWRALLGWPLGATATTGSVGMLNLIGHLPDPTALLQYPGLHLHQYGKQPHPGRKVGHVTIVAPDEKSRTAALAPLVQLLPS